MLPDDSEDATLIGRLASDDGPIPVAVLDGRVWDLSGATPTVADLLAKLEPSEALPAGRDLGPLDDLDLAAAWDPEGPGRLLAPIDLQCVKAAGVTFAVSALERVIEERARGDAGEAARFRGVILDRIGSDLRALRPGSLEAMRLKEMLIHEGAWSQYLEVAIGPDAEVFTKAPVLSSVGSRSYVGIRSDSSWNNPEPEVVMVADPQGRARGAALGNDVNLRDIEGRSALLLGKAKDNNASAALGPFIRLFDASFTLDHVRNAEVSLTIEGEDNFRLEGRSNMAQISRDPLELIGQAIGKHHQYPDGFVLYLGTMFAPVEDREHEGRGFTHKIGDTVSVSTPKLGTLVNKVVLCEDAPPWTYGISSLFRDLARRALVSA
ncbi:fumarylacetoacetate hydrolase family protein [Sphingomonas sp. AOB5]|uniref:fumarylacetoacetate hydrolase family protein n=1 Tax=Sphingomonas sp. AOB5 TaxID=3034017 RepID=UPI0023F68EF3|nr:fumarylacetoacetate hydrolase family protein [Sphingomonas sp. AOB5]MDF7777637.1 fumarylacetoacetate hydrolase family protein [Sphingomonas sp. AOB5]